MLLPETPPEKQSQMTHLFSSTHAVLSYSLGNDTELEEKVRSGKVVIGRLRVYQHYASGLAFVSSPVFPCDVTVSSMENRRQALHGDIVAVELLPEEEWLTATVDAKDGESDDDGSDGDILGENLMMPDTLPDGRAITRWVQDTKEPKEHRAPECLLAKQLSAPAVHDWGGKKPFGVVMTVLSRSHPLYIVARLLDGALGPDETVLRNRFYQFKCYDPLMPNIVVFGRDIPTVYQVNLNKKFFYLCLLTQRNGDFTWTSGRFLTAKIASLMGDVDCVKMNSLALCSAFEVSMKDFSDEAYACVPEVFNIPDVQELQRMGRRDLREEEFVCSIDPATARDLDDALSITRTRGGYRVGVHIADVSYFVPAGSPLDKEACERSTSVYLVEQVIPMLPRKLSEDYCSLNPGGDKFAFSCIFHCDHHGKVTSEWFGQSVIRNRCRLTYEQAQRILDGDSTVFDKIDFGVEEKTKHLQVRVTESIKTLFELASKMRATSFQRGRVTIGNLKIRFHFEDIANPTVPLGFDIERQIDANWLVEELMLLANARVAEKIVEYMPDQALLRSHEPLTTKKAAALRESFGRIGFELRGRSGGSLQALLDKAKKTEYYDGICAALKFSFQSARYIANGCEEQDAYRGHYALALQWYTHFTSPIRRYCDIIAHRQLLCALEIESIVKKRGHDTHHPVMPGEIDKDQLMTRDFFYSMTEVESIVEAANVKKLRARQASDTSLALFFCQYLKALSRNWSETADKNKAPFTPRVQAVVVRVVEKNKSFVLFAKEIAQEVEISLKSKEQSFKGEFQQSGGDDGRKKKENEETVKVKVNKQPKIKKKEATEKLFVNWGPHPETGKDVVEELIPLTTLTAVLTVKKWKGYEELNMIVDPPWARTGVHVPICTTLI